MSNVTAATRLTIYWGDGKVIMIIMRPVRIVDSSANKISLTFCYNVYCPIAGKRRKPLHSTIASTRSIRRRPILRRRKTSSIASVGTSWRMRSRAITRASLRMARRDPVNRTRWWAPVTTRALYRGCVTNCSLRSQGGKRPTWATRWRCPIWRFTTRRSTICSTRSQISNPSRWGNIMCWAHTWMGYLS